MTATKAKATLAADLLDLAGIPTTPVRVAGGAWAVRPDWPTIPDGWRHNAACRGYTDDDLWFPVYGPGHGGEGRYAAACAEAATICAGCPVRAVCATVAITTRADDGVWGGLTTEDRATIRSAVAAGTKAGASSRPFLPMAKARGFSGGAR